MGDVARRPGEPILGNPTIDGLVLSSTAAGVRSWAEPRAIIASSHIISDSATWAFPWTVGALAGGTVSGISVAGHPGIRLMASSTSANSGYRLYLSAGTVRLVGGESFTFVFMVPASVDATTVTRLGAMNNVGAAAAIANGFFASIDNVTLSGHVTVASTDTATASTFALTKGVWYRLRIDVNAANTATTFTLYADRSDTVLWTQTVAAVLPGTTVDIYHGVVSWSTGTTAISLFSLDYLDYALAGQHL